MARMVIAGMAGCSRFAHIDHFAEYLAEKLPDFQYNRILVGIYQWPKYLAELNNKNGWNMTQSPIVWREPGVSGGKAYLVGGASDFWEQVQQYYGILSNVTRPGEEFLAIDAYQKFLDDERETEKREQRQRLRRVTVSGAGHSMTSLLVCELLKTPALQLELGEIVVLFDRVADRYDLYEIAMDLRGIGASAGLGSVLVAETVAAALTDCDLLIVLDGYKKEEGEDLISWLRRNQELMIDLALDINKHAPKTCRVVYAAPETPACFNATVIADVVIDINKENVVAVTADLGLEARSTLATASEVQLDSMYCPPVWGCVGINKWVDLRATQFLHELSMPNRRAMKATPGTTLPTHTTKIVTYSIGPQIQKPDGLWLAVAKDKENSIDEMYIAKVKATCDMLGFWFRKPVPILRGQGMRLMFRLQNITKKNYSDEKAWLLPKEPVISLGVLSDGSFDIPEGLNFSQQVQLLNGRWVPYKHFPITKDRYVKMKDLCALPCALLKELNVGGTLNADYLLSPEDLANKKKERYWKENESKIREAQEDNNIKLAAKAKERALNISFRCLRGELERESEVMIRDMVVATTLRGLIDNVLDICVPYPEKVEVVYKITGFKKDELGGEGGEEQQPEEDEKENEDDEDDEDDEDED